MFRFEKDMIPVLKEYLSMKYKTQYFVDEFNSGNGIADLVFTTKEINIDRESIYDYDLIEIVLSTLNRKNKKIDILKFHKNTYLTKQRVNKLLEFLIQNGNLEKINENLLIVKEKYSPKTKDIISIEAKISDWKTGFYQALRYRTYSNKSYLAISEQYVHRVNLNLLKENGIGLIKVSNKKAKIILRATTKKPTNKIASTYLSEKFCRMI